MNTGVLLGFLAYGAMAWGDAVIKAVGASRLSVFEIGLFVSVFAGIAMLFMRPAGERWRDLFQMRHPWLVALRSLSGIGAGIFGVTAFTSIPFAEAYSLIFMSPFIVTLLSIVLLRERVSWRGWTAMALGFGGVLLVIRPGLRAIEFGHLAAFATAVCIAITVTVLRRIASTEKRTSLLVVPQLAGIAFTGAVTATHYVTPTGMELGLMLISGGFAALGQFALLLAARRIPANLLGQAQYSQLFWAMAAGALFFAEYPDVVAIVGVAVIVVAGILTATSRKPA
jgi:drug/metabolite transporter (DMT)-like permease